MTLVYDRVGPGPRTHVFVIGCGRFPHLADDKSLDRQATVAGARALVQFFLDHADDLIAPLGTIEVLLSDPAEAAGADALALGAIPHDPRPAGDDGVAAANAANAETAGEAWIDRCQAGDHMVFYMSSHGVADGSMRALGLLEDVKASKHAPWKQSIDVSSLASGLPTIGAGGAWVFLDACAEFVREILELTDGPNALRLVTPRVTAIARFKVRPVALVAARFGNLAWAPDDAKPPLFTQALLVALGGAAVEQWRDVGWVVTGKELTFSLSKIANAALDYKELEIELLQGFTIDVALLRVANPMVPVAIRTETAEDMDHALQVTAEHPPTGRLFVRADGSHTWRFAVQPDRAEFLAKASFPPGRTIYQDQTFLAYPPACIVTFKP